MELPRCCYRISLKALILDKNGRFLLCKEDNGLWDLPGGGLELGESIEDCLRRELTEETGFKVNKVDLKNIKVATYVDKKNTSVANIFIQTEVDVGGFTPSRECREYRYFSTDEAKRELVYQSVDELVKLLDEK